MFSCCCCCGCPCCCCCCCDGSHDPTERHLRVSWLDAENPIHLLATSAFWVVLFSVVVFYDPATPETPHTPVHKPPSCLLATVSCVSLSRHDVRNIVARSFSLIIQIIYFFFSFLNLALFVLSPVVFSPNFVKCPRCFCCCCSLSCSIRVCFMTFRGCRFNTLVSLSLIHMSRSS